MFLTKIVVNKNIKSKENFADNQFHITSRLFHALLNFRFTISETIGNSYL